MKNKIVFVFPVLPAYKIEFLKSLNSRLEEAGKQLVVIRGTNIGKKEIKESQEELPFKIMSNQTIGLKTFGYQLQWQRGVISQIAALKPEKVILVYQPGIISDYILMLYFSFTNTPFLIWRCGYKRIGLSDFKFKLRATIKRFFEKKASAHVTYGSYYANKLVEMGYPSDKVFIAQNTINVEKIMERENKSHPVKKHELLHFLFVGALISKKNLDKAIRACKILEQKEWNFKFDIVGGGEIYDELEALITDLNIEDYVVMHGAKYGEDVIPYFRSADVFLLPGTGGLALNEAMAYALPLISAPADGTAQDLIQGGKNGFLLPFNYKIEELAQKMEYFLAVNSKKLKKMGNASKAIVERKATLKNMVEQFLKAIKSVKN